VRIGRVRPLTTDDAPAIPASIHPRNASQSYETLSTEKFYPFILRAFFAAGATSRRVMWLTILRIGVGLSVPILLKIFLEALPSAVVGVEFPIGLLSIALLLGMAGMVQAVIMQHWYFAALSTFAIITNGMNARIVRHALRLRRSARSTMQTGDLVNHLSSDTESIGESGFFVPEFFNSALEIVAVLIVLFIFLGPAAFAALAALALMGPLTVLVARRYRKLDHRIMGIRDERITLMSQILGGIRVVKYYAWEGSVGKEVRDVRAREIKTRVSIVQTDALSTVVFISTTTVVAFFGFGAYVMAGGTLTAPLVFACLALFVMLEEPFGLISHLLANLQHAQVGTKRLHAFFSAPVRADDERPLSDPSQAIGFYSRDLTLKYSDATQAAVDAISIDVKAGSSVAIVGAVGSGKSTLLRVLAGVQVQTSGTVAFDGIPTGLRPRAAYVPQEAFIMNATIHENIVFGDLERENSLEEILEACALNTDLNTMPAGLDTEIGERGVNLSGGQKQRVALARAAWHRPGIVFLDDPLSAVDVHTENKLVDDLLFGMWDSVTRVVVTHRLAHLNRFDHIVYLEAGRVLAQGTFEHLLTTSERFAEYVHEAQKPHAEQQLHAVANVANVANVAKNDEQARFMDDEDRETGAVDSSVFRAYVRAMIGNHWLLAPVILIALLLTAAGITALPILQTSWLGWWTDGATAGKGLWGSIATADVFPDVASPMFAVGVYGLLALVVLLGWLAERLLWLYRSAYAGARIHNAALAGVLAAPLRFFDRTPIGRVLNRFSRDMEAVDDHLTWNFEQSFKSLAQTIGSMVLILAIMPFITLVIIPVLLVYYKLQRDYRASAREAKRMESIARSPRYAQFKELVTGLDVIHGFARERFFVDTFYDILAKYQRAFWCSILLNRWFSIRVPLISGFVALATCIGIVILARNGAITPGTAGLVLTYALGFWMNLNWTVRAFSEVESRMTAVERLRHYASLTPEPQVTVTPDGKSLSAPYTHELLESRAQKDAIVFRGEIQVQGLSVRYADDLPLVLHDVSFRVPACAKVGIVGRTGSGKSTLFQALFRFVEPASGRILIDGIDIASIPLPTLRRAIAIIPQDPTLFIGSIRTNLDRFSECTDDDVWNALRRVRMYDLVKGLPMGLEAPVVENGANFSQGQRQLLCLARAILTRASIIVLDEATASVDVETDILIQRTIREEFKNVTVLIIAHRLNTVADADMIIELSHGQVVSATPQRVSGIDSCDDQ